MKGLRVGYLTRGALLAVVVAALVTACGSGGGGDDGNGITASSVTSEVRGGTSDAGDSGFVDVYCNHVSEYEDYIDTGVEYTPEGNLGQVQHNIEAEARVLEPTLTDEDEIDHFAECEADYLAARDSRTFTP